MIQSLLSSCAGLQALSHPTLGYYTTKTVFGRTGDFVTSPEISQMFGELLAVWCVRTCVSPLVTSTSVLVSCFMGVICDGGRYVLMWERCGQPKEFTLLELGPGKGTLLAVSCRHPTTSFVYALHLILNASLLCWAGLCGLCPSGHTTSLQAVPRLLQRPHKHPNG